MSEDQDELMLQRQLEDYQYQNEESSLNQQKDYSLQKLEQSIIIPSSLLLKEILKSVEQIQSLVVLPFGWSLILLKKFNWSQKSLSSTYFNNPQFHSNSIGYSSLLRQPIELKSYKQSFCDVCCRQQLLFSSICGHSYCANCWIDYLQNNFNSLNPFPKCPNFKCQTPLLFEVINNIIELSKQKEHLQYRLNKLLCEQFCTYNKAYIYCSGLDCQNVIKVLNPEMNFVTCSCGHSFCFKCNSENHLPRSCQQKSKWCKIVLQEEENVRWISQNAKLCPWCKKAVQRQSGCNEMTCRCGKHFCYMCGKLWEGEHIGKYYNCPINKQVIKNIVNENKSKILNRFVKEYENNQAFIKGMKQTDISGMSKFLYYNLNIPLVDSEFIPSSYKLLLQCCQKLKWRIVYSSAFSEESQGKSQSEMIQGFFQMFKNNLAKRLSFDLNRLIKEIQNEQNKLLKKQHFQNTFYGLKKQIINFSTEMKAYFNVTSNK